MAEGTRTPVSTVRTARDVITPTDRTARTPVVTNWMGRAETSWYNLADDDGVLITDDSGVYILVLNE